MESLINHLPQSKKDELKSIVDVICKNCDDVEKVILFGSYARGNYKEAKDLQENRKSGHISDYDILVITRDAISALNTSLWQKISDECRSLNLSADPRILTHDIRELNNKLSVGQYFYTDIKKEGILLYDAGNFELAEKRSLSDKERKEIAKEHFDHWFRGSNTFLFNYKNTLGIGDYGNAAFQLHQSAEHAYKAILLVFTLYNPNEHFLAVLGKECEQYFPTLRHLFPKNTDAEKERFKLLEYAYIGGRYDPKYKISKEDLEILEMDVQKLIGITKKICEDKIQSLM